MSKESRDWRRDQSVLPLSLLQDALLLIKQGQRFMTRLQQMIANALCFRLLFSTANLRAKLLQPSAILCPSCSQGQWLLSLVTQQNPFGC